MTDENSMFVNTFGDYPAIRIMDFLIESDVFDYPITDIAKNSNVHFQTFQKIWPKFTKSDFVVKTRKLGNSQLYKINKSNPVIQKLIELDKYLCEHQTSRAIKKKVLVKARNN